MKHSLKKLMLASIAMALVVPVAIVLVACGKKTDETVTVDPLLGTYAQARVSTVRTYVDGEYQQVAAIGYKFTLNLNPSVAAKIANDATISNLTSTATYSPAKNAEGNFAVSTLGTDKLSGSNIETAVEAGLVNDVTEAGKVVSARKYSSALTNAFTGKTSAEIEALNANAGVALTALFPQTGEAVKVIAGSYAEQLKEVGLVSIGAKYVVGTDDITASISSYSVDVVISEANIAKIAELNLVSGLQYVAPSSIELKADGVFVVTDEDGSSTGKYVVAEVFGIKTVQGYTVNEFGAMDGYYSFHVIDGNLVIEGSNIILVKA